MSDEPTLNPDAVRMESLHIEGGKATVRAIDEPDNGVILAMAAEMGRLLTGATNYVECEVIPNAGSGLLPMTMTVQRRSRPTPHELRKNAEAELAALLASLETLRDQWRTQLTSTPTYGAWSASDAAIWADSRRACADDLDALIREAAA